MTTLNKTGSLSRSGYLNSLREKGSLVRARQNWPLSKRNPRENSKQINKIQTHYGTVREQKMSKHINPLKTIRKRSAKRGGSRKNYSTCNKRHKHTRKCVV
jgi:hypothetical protein